MARNPKARAMLRAYRDSIGYEGEERDALWAKIEGSLDAGTSPLFEEAVVTTSPVRWGLVGAVVGLAAVAVVALSLGSTRGEAGVGEPSSQAPHGVVTPDRSGSVSDPNTAKTPRGRSGEPSVHESAASPEVVVTPPPAAPTPVVIDPANPRPRSKRSGAAGGATPPPTDFEDSLEAELRLIAAARAHLRAARPARALAVLKSHARSFPDGQMREDRLVLRVEALCAEGKAPQARAEARLLLRAYPESAHAGRLQDPCATAAP